MKTHSPSTSRRLPAHLALASNSTRYFHRIGYTHTLLDFFALSSLTHLLATCLDEVSHGTHCRAAFLAAAPALRVLHLNHSASALGLLHPLAWRALSSLRELFFDSVSGVSHLVGWLPISLKRLMRLARRRGSFPCSGRGHRRTR